MKQDFKHALNNSSEKCSNLMDLWILQDFLMQFLVQVNLFNSKNLLSTEMKLEAKDLPRGIKMDSLHINLASKTKQSNLDIILHFTCAFHDNFYSF